MAASKLALGLFAGKGTCSSEWSLLWASSIVVVASRVSVAWSLQRFLVAGVDGGVVKG